MQYEIVLCRTWAGPALERRGPYPDRETACRACQEANAQEHRGASPSWYWAPVGECP